MPASNSHAAFLTLFFVFFLFCFFFGVRRYSSADIEAQVESGFKWILNTSAYLEERSFIRNKLNRGNTD